MRKATIIGAGSTYTPELIQGIVERNENLSFSNITLMDTDLSRLEVVGGLAERQLKAAGLSCEVVLTQDLDRALEGASFVFSQIRVGRMAARICDEKIPLKYGLLGQETTGAGGFMKALRTIPVIMDIAKKVKSLSENGAWIINFANPSGIIAEAVLSNTDVNMIGLCNCPVNMIKGVSDALGSDTFDYEYVGLNHLSWITNVSLPGKSENLVEGLIKNTDISMKNIPGAEYDPSLLKAIPYIPSPYLSYFYTPSAQVQKCLDAEKTRGEVCRGLEDDLLSQYADLNLAAPPAELAQRGGAMYSTAAISAVESIVLNRNDLHVVAAKNNGAVPFMDDDDVVEVLCRLGRDGVVPNPVFVHNDYIAGLMRSVKAYEKLTVKAALEGSFDAALAALMVHPLVGDYDKAKPMLCEMLEANRAFLPRFFS